MPRDLDTPLQGAVGIPLFHRAVLLPNWTLTSARRKRAGERSSRKTTSRRIEAGTASSNEYSVNYELIDLKVQSRIATLTFNRPDNDRVDFRLDQAIAK
jgi:hypothetical protein